MIERPQPIHVVEMQLEVAGMLRQERPRLGHRALGGLFSPGVGMLLPEELNLFAPGSLIGLASAAD